MPLLKSKSKAAFSKNVETEMNAGKPQKQALAIAYATKRKMARGGMVSGGKYQYTSTPDPLNDEEHSSKPAPEGMEEHSQDMERQARADGLTHYAKGGVVDHDEVMEGNIDNFLSDEEDSKSPFQGQAVNSDEQELQEKYDDGSYDALSDLDNEQGDEDQVQARKGVMEQIMRRVRMRNMGR